MFAVEPVGGCDYKSDNPVGEFDWGELLCGMQIQIAERFYK